MFEDNSDDFEIHEQNQVLTVNFTVSCILFLEKKTNFILRMIFTSLKFLSKQKDTTTKIAPTTTMMDNNSEIFVLALTKKF